jgi:hypothetical protein
LNVEIWTTATTVSVDGVAVASHRDGPWLEAAIQSGTITWD